MVNKIYEDNTPNASRLLESLRSSGYDNYTAICDVIDNAFDANADMVNVEIGQSGLGDGKYIISIADNGEGMNADTLDQAMRLGSLTDRTEEDLGKYGMGLITASISLARRLTVITKKDGKYHTAIQDLDDVKEHNKFVKVVRESNDVEVSRLDDAINNENSGTIVFLQKVDKLQNKNISNFQNKLIKECGQIYRYFIDNNKKIYINSLEVRSLDPLMPSLGTEVLPLEEKEFVSSDGKKAYMSLRIAILPEFSDSEEDSLRINQSTQGFYLIRNNRQIAAGQHLNIFTKHNSLNRFRAEILYSSALDEKMNTDFTKGGGGVNNGNGISEDVMQWIKNNTTPTIQTLRNKKKKTVVEQLKKIDMSGSSRVIENKASILKVPRLDKTNIREDFESISNGAFTNVEYKTESNQRLAPLFRYEAKGNTLTIYYNIDHPFYEQVFPKIEDDKNLTNAINHLIYSNILALIGITVTKEYEHLEDPFMDSFSDNLRALLS